MRDSTGETGFGPARYDSRVPGQQVVTDLLQVESRIRSLPLAVLQLVEMRNHSKYGEKQCPGADANPETQVPRG